MHVNQSCMKDRMKMKMVVDIGIIRRKMCLHFQSRNSGKGGKKEDEMKKQN